MAEVPGSPYEPFSTALPTERPIPLQRPEVPETAFGTNIANAARAFGAETEKAGDELWNRAMAINQLTQETNARQALSGFNQEYAKLQSDFDTLKNDAPANALQEHMSNVDKLRQKWRDTLQSPLAQKMYDADAASLQNFAVRSSAGYAATQHKAWVGNTATAQIQQIQGQPVDPQDREAINKQIQDIRDASARWATSQNLDPNEPEAKNHSDIAVSTKLLEHTKDLVNRHLIGQADAFTKEHRTDFRGDNWDLTQRIIQDGKVRVYPKLISDSVNGDSNVAGVPTPFLDEVKRMEGFTPTSKWDVKQYSIGYGTKGKPGEVINEAEASKRFNEEFTKAVQTVDSVNPNLTEGTRAALASLTYNTGEGWTKGRLGQLIAAGDEEGAKAAFSQYVNVAGQPNAAIAARRQQELSWFGKTQLAEKTEQQRVNEGRAIAERVEPGNVELAQATEDRIRHDYNSKRQGEFDAQFNFRQKVANWTLTAMADGTMPRTVDDMRDNPDVLEAWNHLDGTVKRSFLAQLRTNSQSKQGWTDDALRLYRVMKAEAHDDPNAFINEDMVGKSILPTSAKKELINLQQRVKDAPDRDPSLGNNFMKLRNLFPNSVPDPATDKEGALEYKGALLEALNEFKVEKKRDPNFEELKSIGKILNVTTNQQGWFGQKQVKLYELEVPSLVEQVMEARGKDPDTIRREYIRGKMEEQFQKFFGQTAKTEGGVTTSAPAPRDTAKGIRERLKKPTTTPNIPENVAPPSASRT